MRFLLSAPVIALNLILPAIIIADVSHALSPDPGTAAPECQNVGTRSEGWYDYYGPLLKYDHCAGAEAECKAEGTRSEGWYEVESGELITYAECSGNFRFSDVPENHPYFEAIESLQDRGIVSGYSDNTYHPDAFINRAEFTKIVVGAAYASEDIESCLARTTFSAETGIFKDVSWDAWYVNHLCVAVTNEVIGGYADGSFRAGNNINFAEAAKIIALTFPFPTPKPVAGTVWYKPYIDGLRLGSALPESYESPDQRVTRGEMAFMIAAALTLSEQPIPTDQPVVGEGCKVGGCSSQICQNADEEDAITTCEWREEYACYQHAACEKQSNGDCGWTQSEQLAACLEDSE